MEDHGLFEGAVQHWRSLRTHHNTGRRIQDTYNFRLVGSEVVGEGFSIDQGLRIVFQELRTRVKLNVSFGLVLRHTITGELRYFRSSFNYSRFFDEPFSIGSEEDMVKFIDVLLNEDIAEHGRQKRPDTKWVVHEVTNMTVCVNKPPKFVIGAAPTEVPNYVKHNVGLDPLIKNAHTGQFYTDNLCFFRCLARAHGHKVKALERPTENLLQVYKTATRNPRVNGMTIDDLDEAERVFEIKIQVYTLT